MVNPFLSSSFVVKSAKRMVECRLQMVCYESD